MKFDEFLERAYTPYQAVELAREFLQKNGFDALSEEETWHLKAGGRYYVIRGGCSILAFTVGKNPKDGRIKVVGSHLDSPCLKLKYHPEHGSAGYTVLNTEVYGGAILYSFFDRPLKIAGRIVTAQDGVLQSVPYVSPFAVVLPSLAVHMNRGVNEGFAPNMQTELPLLAIGEGKLPLENAVAYDLFVVPAEAPFISGISNEFFSSPRIDNLTSVCASLSALCNGKNESGICIAACFDSEEIGSGTRQGAGSDFLEATVRRIHFALSLTEEEALKAYASSFLISFDNAHAVHPNHPEKADPTNRPVLGGGVVVKSHANGAYTTDALSFAAVTQIMKHANAKYQTFYNRSDMRSGATLGRIALEKLGFLSADLGLAQLAMHSAVETFASADYEEAEKVLTAFYQAEISVTSDSVSVRF